MKRVLRVNLLLLVSAFSGLLVSCSQKEPAAPAAVALAPAPPGPSDLGPANGLTVPPREAVVFDLKYRAQTGATDDIPYFSFWGFGGSVEEAKSNSFIREVKKKVANVYPLNNSTLKGRTWAAVEHKDRQALALYFDLNADRKLSDNERLAPSRKVDAGWQFITPDFMQPADDGQPLLCRILVQANFYGDNKEPNCMWSPASLMEGQATVGGQPARFFLFSNRPSGSYDQYGGCSYSLLLGDDAKVQPDSYIPRESLSTLIRSKGRFYHLTIEGRYSNGLPARALLVKDDSPTGSLAVKLSGSNALHTSLSTLSLKAMDDPSVFLRCSSTNESVALPVGGYVLRGGTVRYRSSKGEDWEVSFNQGPCAVIKSNELFALALGNPTLKVRAIDERNRYSSQVVESLKFKQGTRIYLEPKLLGQGGEVFSRFRQPDSAAPDKTDRPPKVTITRADGKEVLAKTMEYG